MNADHIDVKKIAELARLDLSEQEAATFQPQIDAILGHIEKLNELDTSGVEPTSHAAPVFDRVREDIARPGLERDAFLQNAPDQASGQLRVPQIMEKN